MISYKGKEYVEYDNAIALLEEKEQEIERLNNIINKAIEYIEDYLCSDDYTSGELKEIADVFVELLNSLQGSDNNGK